MDEIQKRLQDATDNCLKAHKAWFDDKKNAQTREGLMECLHELRKVAARLEIEVAISERDQMGARPIPIPSHKSSKIKDRKTGGQQNSNQQDSNNNADNKGASDVEKPAPRQRRRRTTGTLTAKDNS